METHRVTLRDNDPTQDNDPSVDEYDTDKLEADLMAEDRLHYHPVNKVINLSKVRGTDWPGNARIMLPKSVHPSIEAEFQVRSEMYDKVFEQYTKENCNRSYCKFISTHNKITDICIGFIDWE